MNVAQHIQPTIRLLAFGAMGDVIAAQQRPVTAAETVGTLLEGLRAEHDSLSAMMAHPRFRVAVNQTVVGSGHRLKDGDEVALLSPVSGG